MYDTRKKRKIEPVYAQDMFVGALYLLPGYVRRITPVPESGEVNLVL